MKAKGPSSQELYRLVLGMHLPVTQMGENELEWVSVTSGNMNVLNSVFIFCVGPALFWCYAKGRMSLNGCQWLVVTWRGENEAVTFGNMHVLNSAFIHRVGPTFFWCDLRGLICTFGGNRLAL